MKGWTEADIEDLRGDAEVRDEDTTKRPPALEGNCILRLKIEAEVPSLNDYYAGEHWSERKKTRDTWHLLVQSKAPDVRVEEYPVSVECEVRFGDGRKQLDAENVAATAKLITDGLQGCGVLDGDSPQYVREVTLRSTMHDGPTTVLYSLHR